MENTTMLFKRRTLGFVLFVGLAFASPLLRAQDNGDAQTIAARTEAFFANLETKTRTPEDVFTAFLADGRLRDRKEDIRKLVDAYGKLATQYGPTRQVEQVSARAIGKDVYVMTYLTKTDTYPIVWYVTFYRPPANNGDKKNGWGVISLRFDTKIEEAR
jgi:hypothetical protein